MFVIQKLTRTPQETIEIEPPTRSICSRCAKIHETISTDARTLSPKTEESDDINSLLETIEKTTKELQRALIKKKRELLLFKL